MTTTVEKSKKLSVSLDLLNSKLHFKGLAGTNNPVSIDYFPPLGDNLGYTSMELLLLSLSSCIGSSVLVFLRKMNKSVGGLHIEAEGIRRTEHPTGFESISVNLKLQSADTTPAELEKLIRISEETYCPVWSMLKGNVAVTVNHLIIP